MCRAQQETVANREQEAEWKAEEPRIIGTNSWGEEANGGFTADNDGEGLLVRNYMSFLNLYYLF